MFALLLLLVSPVHAWFRVACTSPLVQERVDPIISPGVTPSNHVHTIHGAQNFASNSTYDTLRSSQCTSCLVTQDLSNYWFPKLYFRDPKNGTFTAVPNGGLLVYYQNRGSLDKASGGPGLRAFPPGLKMISGDPHRRSKMYPAGQGSQGELAERAIQWACLRYPSSAGYDSSNTNAGFPHTDCEAGLNARVHMPACWDGKNLDSPDHTSHVAFLSGLDNGDCPSTHPVGFIKMFYEITWNVHEFADMWSPESDAWPFVYATGDPTGYSWHADFQNGWDQTALQNAIDSCNDPTNPTGQGVTSACSFLTVQNATIADMCQKAPEVNEDIGIDWNPTNATSSDSNSTSTVSKSAQDVLQKLPGCNPIQAGPQNATLYSDANCASSTGQGSPQNGTGNATGAAFRNSHHLALTLGVPLVMAVLPRVLAFFA